MVIFAYSADDDTGAPVYYVVPKSQPSGSASASQFETEASSSGMTIGSDDLSGLLSLGYSYATRAQFWLWGLIVDYFVQHHGRQQPAGDNVARWFPSDNTRRYILRYIVTKWIFDGNYALPVKEALSLVPGRERYALELGTRDGTW
jgi:hypothetical protein